MARAGRVLAALAALAVLAPIAIAQADAVQEFSFQLKDVKTDGRFTVVFTSRTYDSTGGIPPVLKENFVRLPKGSELARAVRTKKYQCDVRQLLKDMQANPEQSKEFYDRLDNLTPFISKLKKRNLPDDRKALPNAENCKRARVGQGTAQVDARPLFDELIPAEFIMFLGKGTLPGAVGALQILGMPDEDSAVVKKLPSTFSQTRVPFILNFIKDPTPDGIYGYRIQFPTGPIPPGINISISEVNAVNQGLSVKKKKTTCTKKRKGRCVKKKVKRTNTFWFTQPTCPASGKLSFQAFYGYDDPQPDITRTVELPCPKFKP